MALEEAIRAERKRCRDDTIPPVLCHSDLQDVIHNANIDLTEEDDLEQVSCNNISHIIIRIISGMTFTHLIKQLYSDVDKLLIRMITLIWRKNTV